MYRLNLKSCSTLCAALIFTIAGCHPNNNEPDTNPGIAD
jgi:hypothetical protein